MSDRELSPIDKLVEIEDNTNPDGTVDVIVKGWEESTGNRVDVYFETPTGEQRKDNMPFPSPGDLRENKFYRLVQDAGLSMRNADLLEGEVVRAKNHDTSWSLVTEDRESKVDKLVERMGKMNWRNVIVTVAWFALITIAAISILL